MKLVLAGSLAVLSLACRTSAPPPAGARADDEARRAIEQVLDGFHLAASHADGRRYFGHLAEGAVFLGTDASERWTLPEFRAYCEPHFAQGRGWTYECRERHVMLAGDVAWFDERLWNAKYGECRGTGVLRRHGGEWKIEHYSLTLLVPNAAAERVVDAIRGR